jgi:hypothetical protein
MPSFQKNLLQDVYWSFSEPTPSSPEGLVEAARQYAEDIDCPDPTCVLAAKLPFSDVKLSYTHWVRDESGEWEEREKQLRVVGPGGSLTGAELLWELHVACAATVGENDHHFFEGLELQDAGGKDAPPLYEVVLGS